MNKSLFLLSIFLLFSCSVQKRKYQKGYHFSWSKSVNVAKEKREAPVQRKVLKTELANERVGPPVSGHDDIVASGDNNTVMEALKNKKSVLFSDAPCDDIIFSDGSEIKAKVIEVTPTEIKYKKCEMQDGPVYIVKRSSVFLIKYANGTREVFKIEGAGANQGNQNKPVAKGNQITHPYAISSFVLGILSFVPFITSPFLAVWAIKYGNRALKGIAAAPAVYKGEGLAVVGRLIGIIIAAIWLLAIALLIITIVLFL